ncbi:anthranilate phosphoribosyltransferase [Cyanobacterium sp. uoEpiScrs1]|uniref:anthranilate phosphoribosyltransferase n=1 Tax=Cyanobacterium sp. uoEpiScrs1 TaxID=2976343 RepID=UPI00226AE9C3|nr:anthranilate phosphoribosyltransferase [Cyanobacterium sp. uoEpiScrs1]
MTQDFSNLWIELLQQLLDKKSLSKPQASKLMQGWISETIPPIVSGAILAAIQSKGVSGSELAGMAQVLQSQSLYRTSINHGEPVIDTCGTGGDGASTFNISTAVAFVAATAGVKVAKHGNRSASSKVGSADVLEYLGIKLSTPLEKVEEALSEVGITFLFAPGWHPAMKHVASFRKALKVRTIFNLLGPLVNPLRPTGQIIGVYSSEFIRPMAEALNQLGTSKAIIVHGRDKLDEAGLQDPTDLVLLNKKTFKDSYIIPSKLGLNSAPLSALKGGNIEKNATIIKDILQGKGTIAQEEVVALNASLALQVGEITPWESHTQGIAKAKDILKSGAAWEKLEALAKFLGQF